MQKEVNNNLINITLIILGASYFILSFIFRLRVPEFFIKLFGHGQGHIIWGIIFMYLFVFGCINYYNKKISFNLIIAIPIAIIAYYLLIWGSLYYQMEVSPNLPCSCGEPFIGDFEKAVKDEDPSICYDYLGYIKKVKKHKNLGSKVYNCCVEDVGYPGNKFFIQLNSKDSFEESCIKSMASATGNSMKFCNLLKGGDMSIMSCMKYVSNQQLDLLRSQKHIECFKGQMIGDLDNNGIITNFDQTLLLEIIEGNINFPKDVCCVDINQDGSLDFDDEKLLFRIIRGNAKSPGIC